MGGTPEEDALILAINNKDAQEVERILITLFLVALVNLVYLDF